MGCQQDRAATARERLERVIEHPEIRWGADMWIGGRGCIGGAGTVTVGRRGRCHHRVDWNTREDESWPWE